MKPYKIKILKPGSINANLPKDDSSWTVEQVGDTKLYRLGDGYIIESGTDFRWRFQNPGFQANGQDIRTFGAASNRLVQNGPFYQSGTQILATDSSGTTKSLHEAAEMVYATKHIFDTNKKLYNASKLNHQRKVVLFGHYGAKKGIQLVFPNGFVFGHPYSDKIYGRIDGGAVLGRSYASTSAQVLILGSDNPGHPTLDQHRITIHSSLDWCVFRPEKKVGGLIFCTMCHNLATRNSFDFRYVFTRGLICGPCRDHLEENFKCPAFFWENL